MKIDPHRPLAPQLEDAFDPKVHGTTVPDILREMARRLDSLDNLKYNLARRLAILDAHLEAAGIPPSHVNTDKPGLDSGHEAPNPQRPGDPQEGDPES